MVFLSQDGEIPLENLSIVIRSRGSGIQRLPYIQELCVIR